MLFVYFFFRAGLKSQVKDQNTAHAAALHNNGALEENNNNNPRQIQVFLSFLKVHSKI